jgi:hypothetical protein
VGLEVHRHSQVSSTVIGVIKYCNFASAGVLASNLYSVLDGFGSRIKQGGSLFKVSWGVTIKDLADLDVWDVRGHSKKRVSELLNLLDDGINYLLVGVTYGHNTNTASKINQLVAVNVDQDGAVGALDVYRKQSANTVTYFLKLLFMQFLGLGSWDGGH